MYELLVRPVVVVLDVAGLGALAAADADAEVEGVAELDAGDGARVLDGDLGAVLLEGLALDAAQDEGQLVLAHLLVVLLEKLLHRLVFGPGPQRGHGVGEGAGAEGGAEDLEGDAALRLGGRSWSVGLRGESRGDGEAARRAGPAAAGGGGRRGAAPGSRAGSGARGGRGSRRSGSGYEAPGRDPSGPACPRGSRGCSRGTGARGTGRRAASRPASAAASRRPCAAYPGRPPRGRSRRRGRRAGRSCPGGTRAARRSRRAGARGAERYGS